ncbi:MAG: hypothetical protein HYU04_02330 [Candidatus Wildermuthbacteria bacterium]|nr:hypothetical protein [Candidatus Wildermuthbacteria bacterium]
MKREAYTIEVPSSKFQVPGYNQRGVSLYMIFMIMTLLLGIGFGMSALLLTQLDTLRGIGYSVLAFYATDAGIDRVLYIDQKDCASDPDRITCLHTIVDPLGTQTLNNTAQYALTIESPGGSCTTPTYCVKSVGTYQQARRAVRVGR